MKKAGEDTTEVLAEMKQVSDTIAKMDITLRNIDDKLNSLLMFIPNLPHKSVPVGKNENDNKIIGEIAPEGFSLKSDKKFLDHVELGKKLNILDFERGAKISGSGFPVYKGMGATLERALLNFMLNVHLDKHGYTEIFPPFLCNRESMFGTGQLPKLEDDMYFVGKDDLFLIPTAEVPVTNLHRDEILDGAQLPIKYVAYSACFRREAGSYGKETRGFLRVHQFNKVEMVNIVPPEKSDEFHETMLKEATKILELLNIPYRIMLLCSGDLSFAAAKCYDIETWSPAENKWLEASSVSKFEDFQGRRANIRFKRDGDTASAVASKKPEFVHTLNGSGLATTGLMVTLLENYQKEDGTIEVPEVLVKYTGFELIGLRFLPIITFS